MEPGTPLATPPAPPAAQSDTTAKIVYVLYLVGLVTGGIGALVGVIMAYVNVGAAPEPLRTHYRFQIRTFWISILYCIASAILTILVIGWLLFTLVAVWYIVRCAKGLQYLGRGQAYPNAGTWLW